MTEARKRAKMCIFLSWILGKFGQGPLFLYLLLHGSVAEPGNHSGSLYKAFLFAVATQ